MHPTCRILLAWLAISTLSCVPGAEPFLSLAGPKDVVKVVVIDEEGIALWILEADPPQTLESIHFGVVPPGFTQLEPGADPPRPLIPGEALTTETTTATRFFTHFGVARTPTTMVIMSYTMHLRASVP